MTSQGAILQSAGTNSCAIIVPCGSRKKVKPSTSASAVNLPILPQIELETAWQNLLSEMPIATEVASLYSGRGFHLAKRAAEATKAPLYVISAGLGLVSAARKVPTYGLTVAGRGPETISCRVSDTFNASAWWNSVSQGPYATPLQSVFFATSDAPVLIALSQPYARMMSSALDRLTDDQIARLRIVGVKLERILSRRVRPQILPYDERLDGALPGTQSDFPQRAIFHFVSKCLRSAPTETVDGHRQMVSDVLADSVAPKRDKRPKVSDQDILHLIRRHLKADQGIGRLLRLIRDQDRVACEQARFSRLYRQAVESRMS